MPVEVSVRLKYLHQDKGVKMCERVKTSPNYSESNIYIHAKLPDEVAKLMAEIEQRKAEDFDH